MLFVTVGAQMPFDRLIRTVDDWAGRARRTDVLAQIGPADWEPRHVKWVRFMDSPEFNQRLADASVIVSHAGMGTILSALYAGKPVLVLPRRGDLRETRNDHQLATARQFQRLGNVHVAIDEAELAVKLDRLDSLARPEKIGAYAGDSLIAALRDFINEPA